MQRLWEEERGPASTCCALATLERLGGAGGDRAEHLERALDGAHAAGEGAGGEDVFNQLVTPSGTKIAHGIGDLAELRGASEARARAVLAQLVRERILRPVGGDGGERAHEIFHDVLAEPSSPGGRATSRAVRSRRSAARRAEGIAACWRLPARCSSRSS